MSEEGEFKRRVNFQRLEDEIEKLDCKERLWTLHAQNVIGERVASKRFLEIVDEARKECPINPIIEAVEIYNALKNHTEEEKQIVIKEHLKNCNLEAFILNEVDWVLRWFGEPKR